MDDALKKKVMVGVLVALVGMVVWLRWPEGAPGEPEYVEDDEPWKRQIVEEDQNEMVQQRRRNVEEEDDMAPTRRRATPIDEPIRRRSKKPTAKEELVPAV